MLRNRVLTKKIQTQSRNRNINGIFLTDRIGEINGYQNIVNNKKRIINKKIHEEEKYLEKSLIKISNKLNNLNNEKLKNENKKFSEKYNNFSKTNFMTIESLVGDLSEIYYKKGFKIPNLHNNLFKINPLLENKINKIYLSNILKPKRKISKRKRLFNSNKAITYMNKLQNLISSEKEEEDDEIKIKAPNKIEKKIIKKRIKIGNKSRNSKKILINSIKNIIKLINKNDSNDNEDFSCFRKRNKSEVKKRDNVNNYNILYNTNIIKNEKIIIKDNISHKNESKKSLHSYYNRRNNKKNATISKYTLNNENNNNNCNIFYNKKSFNSSKKLKIPILNSLSLNQSINKIKDYNKEKDLYFETERKINKNNNKFILNTPNNLKNINSSLEKSSKNTKAFSITNEYSSLTFKSKLENNKTKDSPSLRIKEFTINSYKSKKSETSGKASSNQLRNEAISKSDKKIPLEFRITSPKSKNKNEEEKQKIMSRIYKQFNFGDFKDIEKNLKVYLTEVKHFNEKEVNEIIEKYDYKNLNTNIQELKNIINEKEIEKKIFRLYLNNHDYNRIEPLLKKLNNKDKEILQFNKKIAKISVNC